MTGDPGAAGMRWLWQAAAHQCGRRRCYQMSGCCRGGATCAVSGAPPSRVGDEPDNQADSTEGGAHGQSDQFRRGRRQVRHALLTQSKVDQITAVPGAPGVIPSFEVDS